MIIPEFILTTLLVVYCSAFRATTPLIKNVQRGGIHFEGPHWSAAENALYWVDIQDQKVYRFDAETSNITCKSIVSLVVTVKDYPKLILVSVRSELYFLSWDSFENDSSLRLLSVVDLGLPDNRCNDGKVDAKGRLWFGNRRTLFSFQANNVTGVPDGMTIDSDGNLWVACFNGWKVTSVMWGGHDLSTLFVTTSKVGLSQAELNAQPEAGSLFAIEGTGAKGLPENQFVFANAATF
ncbi:hypothetical protein HF086_002978 [Spodoptera exigua]|uniref:SMP-30/Gluconolactonase/LRE-like region domain-containing protein n=1 Tax=Spodoptera exigua TaxID=7107 RepID=A0A922SMS2_SPOEX|nr:hypothetical protein HF086_002978 [Spodoptera exigua]